MHIMGLVKKAAIDRGGQGRKQRKHWHRRYRFYV